MVVLFILLLEFFMVFFEVGLLVVNVFGCCGDDLMVYVVGIDDVVSGVMVVWELMDWGYWYVGFLGGFKGVMLICDCLCGF